MDLTNVATWNVQGIGNIEIELNNVHQEYKNNTLAIT